MIIGISGKAGSGKDTAGRIIQYLTLDKQVFNMSNESIIYDFNNNWKYANCSKWEIRKFAEKVKEIVSLITGASIEDLEDQEFKKSIMPLQWQRVNDEGKRTYRQFLQEIGTDIGRHTIHKDVWVNALFAEYDIQTSKTIELNSFNDEIGKPKWIITDVRFPNEAEAIKNRGGILIRIERAGLGNTGNHPSETSLDDWDFDYYVINEWSLENFIEKIKAVVETINL